MYINLQYQPMPKGIHGCTVLNSDGGFTVFIDPGDSDVVQKEAYIHEVEHIKNGDFDNICDKNHREIENRAHKKRL